MTEDEIAILQDSFAKAARRADELVDTFYGLLFRATPSLRDMFPADLADQKKKLTAALAATVRLVDRPEVLAPNLRELGARHGRYGVEAAHYALVGTALIGALERILAADFTAEVRRVWIEAFAFVETTMLEGVVDDATVTVL